MHNKKNCDFTMVPFNLSINFLLPFVTPGLIQLKFNVENHNSTWGIKDYEHLAHAVVEEERE